MSHKPEEQQNMESGIQSFQGVPAFDLNHATNGQSSSESHTSEMSTAEMDAIAEGQFYQTKLFRVLVAKKALVHGHVIIEPKRNIAHVNNFDLDEMEEFGYLLKKVSFWSMRFVGAHAFSVIIHDGTPEVDLQHPLQVHILPRHSSDDGLAKEIRDIAEYGEEVDPATVMQIVAELKDLMQLPQL